jgi:hypothetical protein
MNMTRHDAISVKIHPLVLSAIFPAMKDHVFILVPYKKINPIYHGVAQKIKFILIAEFVSSTHAKL